MTETWLSVNIAIPRLGPPQKQGYIDYKSRALVDIRGEIKHSMVGPFYAALGTLLSLSNNTSWHFSVLQNGTVYQHYPLETIAWHAGFMADLAYIGVEHEGGPLGPRVSQLLTKPQYQSTLRLTRELRRLLPHLGPPSRETNLREHKEFMATACPSERIPWDRLIGDLTMPGYDLIYDVDCIIPYGQYIGHIEIPDYLPDRYYTAEIASFGQPHDLIACVCNIVGGRVYIALPGGGAVTQDTMFRVRVRIV